MSWAWAHARIFANLGRLRASAVLLLLACCGGAGDSSIDITFDPCTQVAVAVDGTATDAERASVAEAVTMWNRLGATQLRVATGGEPTTIPVRFEDAAQQFHGVYEDEAGIIFVNRKLDDDHARAVTVAHELGHAFGLPHIDLTERVSVMNQANLIVEPNLGDQAALTALWTGCR
jgi:hypothetical protein